MVELSIFDCAGQGMFNQLETNARYYDGASAVMVVYDVSSNDSLKSSPKWLEAVRNAQRSSSQRSPIGVLVGNKKDFRIGAGAAGSDSRAEVVREDAQRTAAAMGLQLFEASAVRCALLFVVTTSCMSCCASSFVLSLPPLINRHPISTLRIRYASPNILILLRLRPPDEQRRRGGTIQVHRRGVLQKVRGQRGGRRLISYPVGRLMNPTCCLLPPLSLIAFDLTDCPFAPLSI